MLASKSGSVFRTKPPLPAPGKPSRSRFGGSDFACFYPGSRSRPSFAAGHKLSLNLIEMEVLRRMGGGCFKKGLKMEADSGGEDFFDASGAVAKPVSEHLVIMVNGIIGGPADWRYAAEQFVKKLPDKIIVHLNATLQD